jgi:hypothetical protein
MAAVPSPPNWLGSDWVPGRYVIRPPNRWEFFGFDGPTNKHNLQQAYRKRLNSGNALGDVNVVFINAQYARCLEELNDANTP